METAVIPSIVNSKAVTFIVGTICLLVLIAFVSKKINTTDFSKLPNKTN